MNCPGCQNPDTHAFTGPDLTPAEVAQAIFRKAAPGTEGITISGGEPMQQPVSLRDFIREIKARRPDWTIGLFSGYTADELRTGSYFSQEKITEPILWWKIRRYLDFAVLGRYDRTRSIPVRIPESMPWLNFVSSANQSLELYTTRYTHADFASRFVEYSIQTDGLTTITGFPVLPRA